MDLEKVARFNGIKEEELNSWKQPIQEGNIKFYPPYGKHNLYKGAMLSYYLLSYDEWLEDDEEVSEHFNNLDYIEASVQKIESLAEGNEELLKEVVNLKQSLKELKNITEIY